MKLSEIKGERVFDVIADLVDPVAAIATSDEVKELRTRRECPDGVDPRDYMAARIRRVLPKLIREHKADAIKVLATIEGVTPDEYAESLTLPKLISDATELVSDEVFMDFLASAAPVTE